MPNSRPAVRWSWIIGLNLLFAFCFVAAPAPAVPAPLRMVAAALPILVLPGVAWLGLFKKRTLSVGSLALTVTGISTLVTLGAIGATALGPEPPSPGLAIAWIVLAGNAGVLLAGPPGPLAAGVRWGLLAFLAAAGFAIASTCATRVVPPLEDHDMELRDTAYGLASTFQPYQLTNRELYVQAAHPILFHFHVAGSLLLSGDIEASRTSYDLARRAEEAVAAGEEVPWTTWWRSAYEALLARPALTGTRAPSCLLSALALAMLGHLAILLTGRPSAAVAAGALYMSFPETLVRASYAGYFPPTVFATLVIVLLLVDRDDAFSLGPLPLAFAAAFAAMLNHKAVVLVLAVVALAGLDAVVRVVREGRLSPRGLWNSLDRRASSLVVGFGAGTAVWWAYGLSTHAQAFVQDHLRKHLVHRALLHDFRLGASPDRYAPGMLDVWIEFNAHTGYLFVPSILVVAALVLLKRGGADRMATPVALLATWFLVGAILYTLIDWRQTKHLMNQLPAMVAIGIAFVWPLVASGRVRPPGGHGGTAVARAAVAVALAIVFAFNVAADVRLVRDFGSLRISGASDIDGW